MVGAAEGLMNGAVAMAAAAGILPPALVIAFQFKLASGKPQNLEKAANKWAESAAEVRTAIEQWKSFVSGIPTADWNADDREKYQQAVDDYCLQMEYLHNYCMAVHYALISLAWALFVYAIAAIAIAAFLAALATAAVASLGTLYAACLSLAGTALTVTYVMTGILATAGQMCAAVLAGGAAVTANKQAEHGSQEAATAFKQALLTGSAGAGANLLEGAANTGLAWLNRANGEFDSVPWAPGKTWGHRGYGLQSIDLDADRAYDTTWNVGGGAKVKIPHEMGPEFEVSGHRKYGPEGYAGGDFELKGKQPGPGVDLTGGVKREWNAEGEEKTTYSTGLEQPHTGAKGAYEGTVNPDGTSENKATWVAPWGSQEKNFDPPWDSGK
ncbi:hypothetical protein [Actinomadura sp. WMMB 499]|uniref:hypothetical protein n=1 Tax=Actinomadura sp. WMMB 499 TaxID=1219491 RepID=UPI001245E89C|nr:hypothetical protein [Actinomadura sp. WMMB 499]QFG22092.1 hypothetical protein F7P10_14110 [Actinomadura sp. WMMB 499]